jgi:hypothetical protein
MTSWPRSRPPGGCSASNLIGVPFTISALALI